MGRKSTYSHAKADEICRRLATGESLESICKDERLPPAPTVRGWVVGDVHGFAAGYARAREIGLDAMADELLAISNTPQEGIEIEEGPDGVKTKRGDMLGHRKLQIDARKWYLSKIAPKKYGDRLEVKAEVNVSFSERLERARKRSGE
jgi:hypothetical protein